MFVAGALATAIAAELMRRFFDRARIELRVADLALNRTRDRFQNDLEMTPDLRRLLSEWPVQDLSWGKTFFCEDDLDVGILDTFEEEQQAVRASEEFSRLIQLLHNANIPKLVFEFACNGLLRTVARNGLIAFRDRAPQVPTQPVGKPVFPVHTRTAEIDGSERYFLQLDLHGNASPTIGDANGVQYVNELLAPFVYALSYADKEALAAIFNLAKEYSELSRQNYRAIREELVNLKNSTSYLAVQLVVANVGKEPALLSQRAALRLGEATGTLVLTNVDERPADDDKRTRSTVLRTRASNLRQRYKIASAVLDRYESPLSHLVINAGESARFRFVSLDAVSTQQRDAVQAARSGHLTVHIELRRAVARSIGRVARLARYGETTRYAQRITVGNAPSDLSA